MAEKISLMTVYDTAQDLRQPFSTGQLLRAIGLSLTPVHANQVTTLLKLLNYKQDKETGWISPSSPTCKKLAPSPQISAAYRKEKVTNKGDFQMLLARLEAQLPAEAWKVAKYRWVDFMTGRGLSRCDTAACMALPEWRVESYEDLAAAYLAALPRHSDAPIGQELCPRFTFTTSNSMGTTTRGAVGAVSPFCLISSLQPTLDRAVRSATAIGFPMDSLDSV